jgi:hypothetical protein
MLLQGGFVVKVTNLVDADRVISYCNKATVDESEAAIKTLSFHDAHVLFWEYHHKADGRFGDNLLVACSTYQFDPYKK